MSFKTISNATLSAEYNAMNDFNKMVTKMMDDVSEKSRPPFDQIWYSSLLNLYSLQQSLSKGVLYSLLLSVGLSAAVLLLTTLDVAIMTSASLTISSAVVVTIASLVLMGWELNMFESMTISLAVGLSIDFAIHLGVAYKLSDSEDEAGVESGWKARVGTAFSTVGSAVSMAALTTFVAGASIMMATIFPTLQLGKFLIIVMVCGWTYAVFFFVPLTALIDELLRRLKKSRSSSSTFSARDSDSIDVSAQLNGFKLRDAARPDRRRLTVQNGVATTPIDSDNFRLKLVPALIETENAGWTGLDADKNDDFDVRPAASSCYINLVYVESSKDPREDGAALQEIVRANLDNLRRLEDAKSRTTPEGKGERGGEAEAPVESPASWRSLSLNEKRELRREPDRRATTAENRARRNKEKCDAGYVDRGEWGPIGEVGKASDCEFSAEDVEFKF